MILRTWSHAAARFLFFGLIWVVLAGTDTATLAVGLAAAIPVTWMSYRLLPPGLLGLHPMRLVAFVPHFLWQSVASGTDVAWRALRPRMDIDPGFVLHRHSLPTANAREIFADYVGLLPGSLVVRTGGRRMLVHMLDRQLPADDLLVAEERRIARLLERGKRGPS